MRRRCITQPAGSPWVQVGCKSSFCGCAAIFNRDGSPSGLVWVPRDSIPRNDEHGAWLFAVFAMKKPTGRHFGVFGTLSRGPCEARCAAPEASGGAFAWPVPLCTRRRGPAVLLGNSRYYLEEEGKGKGNEGNKTHAGPTKVKAFRESMAKLAVTYCSDAFGTAHTAHGSMVGEGYPIKCPAYLLTKEPDFSAKVIGTPTRSSAARWAERALQTRSCYSVTCPTGSAL